MILRRFPSPAALPGILAAMLVLLVLLVILVTRAGHAAPAPVAQDPPRLEEFLEYAGEVLLASDPQAIYWSHAYATDALGPSPFQAPPGSGGEWSEEVRLRLTKAVAVLPLIRAARQRNCLAADALPVLLAAHRQSIGTNLEREFLERILLHLTASGSPLATLWRVKRFLDWQAATFSSGTGLSLDERVLVPMWEFSKTSRKVDSPATRAELRKSWRILPQNPDDLRQLGDIARKLGFEDVGREASFRASLLTYSRRSKDMTPFYEVHSSFTGEAAVVKGLQLTVGGNGPILRKNLAWQGTEFADADGTTFCPPGPVTFLSECADRASPAVYLPRPGWLPQALLVLNRPESEPVAILGTVVEEWRGFFPAGPLLAFAGGKLRLIDEPDAAWAFHFVLKKTGFIDQERLALPEAIPASHPVEVFTRMWRPPEAALPRTEIPPINPSWSSGTVSDPTQFWPAGFDGAFVKETVSWIRKPSESSSHAQISLFRVSQTESRFVPGSPATAAAVFEEVRRELLEMTGSPLHTLEIHPMAGEGGYTGAPEMAALNSIAVFAGVPRGTSLRAALHAWDFGGRKVVTPEDTSALFRVRAVFLVGGKNQGPTLEGFWDGAAKALFIARYEESGRKTSDWKFGRSLLTLFRFGTLVPIERVSPRLLGMNGSSVNRFEFYFHREDLPGFLVVEESFQQRGFPTRMVIWENTPPESHAAYLEVMLAPDRFLYLVKRAGLPLELLIGKEPKS